jgi:hypothetical protein
MRSMRRSSASQNVGGHREVVDLSGALSSAGFGTRKHQERAGSELGEGADAGLGLIQTAVT